MKKIERRDFLIQSGLLASGFMAFGTACAGEKFPALKGHKIAKIESLHLNYHWPRLVGKNARKDVHGHHKKVSATRIYTDQGAIGWGAGNIGDEGNAFIGKKVSELIDPDHGIRVGVPGSMDLALHDLAGIILNKPVYQMLGAKGPKSTSMYSGMIYLDELEPKENPSGLEKVLENCRWDLDYGYRKLKVKIGRSNMWYPHDAGLKKDIEVVNTIYDTFKDRGVEILVDANDGYSLEDCIQFLRGIEGVPLYWFEEPFEEDLVESKKLRDWMHGNGFEKTYFADGEYKPDYEYCMEMAKQGILDVYLADVVGFGFTKWRNAMPLLEKYDKLASPHAWGTALKTNCATHLSAGLGRCCTIEGVTCLSDEIDFGNYPLVDGMVTVSEAPGFGMNLLV